MIIAGTLMYGFSLKVEIYNALADVQVLIFRSASICTGRKSTFYNELYVKETLIASYYYNEFELKAPNFNI
jgi:hypothetical protein